MAGNISHDWKGQNIPCIHTERGGRAFAILPVLEFLLEYDEVTIYDLLPSSKSYGWNDDLMNTMAWANNAYRVVNIEPDFTRYGCLPSWFPTTDRQEKQLTPQGQVDRFLYLLGLAYGGLPEDHRKAEPKYVTEAILELWRNMGEYMDIEEGDNMEWELSKSSE